MLGRLVFVLSIVLLSGSHACADGPMRWHVTLQTSSGGETWIGVDPGCADGYDGQQPLDVTTIPSDYPNLFLYREHGPAWAGPTGFYGGDYESPIPAGGSKTWWDLYLWTGSASHSPTTSVRMLADGPRPPSGYWARLVLDYVPTSLGWTGPMEFTAPLYGTSSFLLPVPVVSDGLEGTRMHLTVYTTPIPEPSGMMALGMGALGVLAPILRRRR